MADDFAGSPAQTTGANFPATWAEVVVPHNSANLAKTSRGIYVGGAGDVAAVMRDGPVVTFSNVIRATRINLTNTTATLMLSLA